VFVFVCSDHSCHGCHGLPNSTFGHLSLLSLFFLRGLEVISTINVTITATVTITGLVEVLHTLQAVGEVPIQSLW
jgi:hypothetical protein